MKIGIILILVGMFVPSVIYPITSSQGLLVLYKEKAKIIDAGTVFREALEKYRDYDKAIGVLAEAKKELAIPYRYIVSFGITLVFVGTGIVVLSIASKNVK